MITQLFSVADQMSKIALFRHAMLKSSLCFLGPYFRQNFLYDNGGFPAVKVCPLFSCPLCPSYFFMQQCNKSLGWAYKNSTPTIMLLIWSFAKMLAFSALGSNLVESLEK